MSDEQQADRGERISLSWPSAPTPREAQVTDRDRGTTHWEGCWRSHPRCAEARKEAEMGEREARIRERAEAKFPSWSDCRYLLSRVERYREALEEVEAKPEEAIQKIRDNGFVFETDLSRDDLTETERWEKLAFTLYTILVSAGESAHRALNDGEDDG